MKLEQGIQSPLISVLGKAEMPPVAEKLARICKI